MVTHFAERLPVAIGGVSYLVDAQQLTRSTIPALREQRDSGTEPGENTLDATGVWVRSQTDWSYGAGQRRLDAADSDRRRFRSSVGVDVWTKGQVSLLRQVDQKYTSTASNVKVHRINDGTTEYLYLSDGTDLKFTQNPEAGSPTWSTVTALGSPQQIVDFHSDGATVFIAYGAAAVLHEVDVGSTAQPTTLGAQTPNLVEVAAGRLIAADGNQIVELNALGGIASGLNDTVPHAGFAWSSISGGPGGIFAAGNHDTTGAIWQIQIDTSNGQLLYPTVVAKMPHGEEINAIAPQGSVLWVATSKGMRLAAATSAGQLTVSPVIDEVGSIFCVETDGRFAWGGSTAGETFRFDPSVFTDTLTPAWAADADSGQGANIQSIARVGGRTYLSDVDGEVWGESGSDVKVTSGTLTVGDVSWNVAAPKAIRTGQVRYAREQYGTGDTEYDESTFTYDQDLPYDGGSPTSTGQTDMTATNDDAATSTLSNMSSQVAQSFSFTRKTSQAYEIKLTLTRDTTTTTLGPVVEEWGIKALPVPPRSEEIIVPIVLARRVGTSRGQGAPTGFSSFDEFNRLKGWMDSGEVVAYEEGDQSVNVLVDRLQMQPRRLSDDAKWWEGVLLVRLITVP
jgi:hypothetical protein